MKDLRKADKYRFSLQWSGNTQERVAAGELLEKLGNKKSDFIVLATVFQGAKMPSQKAFMPLTLTPRTDGIYQPTNHKKSTPAFR